MLILAASIGLLCIAFLLGLAVGPVSLDIGQVWHGLFGGGDPLSHQIVWNLRLPRALAGIMVGMSLAVSGAIYQGVTRNPLAEPHIVGVSAGAVLVAMLMLVLVPSAPMALLPIVAFGGALVAGGVVYSIAWRGGTSPIRLVLAGVSVTYLLTAATAAVIARSGLTTQATLSWLIGGLAGRGWSHTHAVWPYVVVGIIVSLAAAPRINVLVLGDEVARGLGMRVEAVRLALLTLAALLAGSAVAIAGLIGFVGLIIPHAARMVVGSDYRYVLPVSVCLGGALLVLADTAARTMMSPRELPVGALTAAVGAPVFLFLVRSRG